ncbi:lipase family protein, partial [Campylobacter jejuni]|nr:lipase family protein [Campylobacter jejuni]
MYENLVPLLYQQTISDKFFEGGSSFFDNSNVRDAFGKYHLGGDNVPTPKAPVYMFHAKADAVVPYGDAYQ